jgi:hypothetical protein
VWGTDTESLHVAAVAEAVAAEVAAVADAVAAVGELTRNRCMLRLLQVVTFCDLWGVQGTCCERSRSPRLY